jgi:hypothetical protein
MLELPHWEPNGASLRALAALEEKGLADKSHFVDVLAREAVRAALAKGGGEDPFTLAAPGPETTRWG